MHRNIPLVLIIVILLTLTLDLPITHAQVNLSGSGLSKIWAIDDSEKIKNTDIGGNVRKDASGAPLPESIYNTVWNADTQTVNLFGARNEMLAFQLILESVTGTSGITISLDKLTGPNNFILTNGATNNSDPYNYVDKNIEIFKPLYVATQSKYPYYTGTIPEAMIPAIPANQLANLSIPSNRNQSVWFDIYIDANAPAGNYTGNITISHSGTSLGTIPVKLQIYNITLPAIASLKNMFFFDPSSLNARHGKSDQILQGKYYAMAHRHFIDLIPNFNLNEIKSYFSAYLNGSNYNPQHGYEGPGQNAHHTMYSIGTYDLQKTQPPSGGERSGWSPINASNWASQAAQWLAYFKTNGLQDVDIFRYMPDEPYWPPETREAGYAALAQEYALLNNTGMRSFCTTILPDSRAEPYCDIKSATDDFLNLPRIIQLQSEGKPVGFYNGYEPRYGEGVEHLHYNLTSARVVPWFAERYHMHHYFLWETTYGYTFNYDLYTNPNFAGPGNALLFYAGIDSKSTSDPGIDGPIGSVRLKGWRRGMQDHAYLQLAKSAGLQSQVNQIVLQTVPKGFSEVSASDQPSWYQYGYQFENQRRKLAQLIDKSPTNTPTPTPTLTITPSPTKTPTTTQTPIAKLGDANKDGLVNVLDYSILANTFGSTTDLRANFNNDSVINILDYQILVNNFGK